MTALSYQSLLIDPYPPFTASAKPDYPVRMYFAGPCRSTAARRHSSAACWRFRCVARYVAHIMLEVCAVVAWIMWVFTGRLPRGLFDPMVLANSYIVRSDAYLFLLTETYPPFQDEQTRTAGMPEGDQRRAVLHEASAAAGHAGRGRSARPEFERRTGPRWRRAPRPASSVRRRRRSARAAKVSLTCRRMRLRASAAIGCAALAILAAGCGGGQHHSSSTATPDTSSTAPQPPARRQRRAPPAAPGAAVGAGADCERPRLPAPGDAEHDTRGRDNAVADAAGVALAVFPSAAPGTHPTVVTLAPTDDWQAALASSVLMAPPIHAPVLLSGAGPLPAATSDALKVLAPTGTGSLSGAQVVLIGDVPKPSGLRAATDRWLRSILGGRRDRSVRDRSRRWTRQPGRGDRILQGADLCDAGCRLGRRVR